MADYKEESQSNWIKQELESVMDTVVGFARQHKRDVTPEEVKDYLSKVDTGTRRQILLFALFAEFRNENPYQNYAEKVDLIKNDAQLKGHGSPRFEEYMTAVAESLSRLENVGLVEASWYFSQTGKGAPRLLDHLGKVDFAVSRSDGREIIFLQPATSPLGHEKKEKGLAIAFGKAHEVSGPSVVTFPILDSNGKVAEDLTIRVGKAIRDAKSFLKEPPFTGRRKGIF